MKNIRTNMCHDVDSMRCMNELPRRVNASRIMRYVLKAIVMNDAEFEAFKRDNAEAAECREYLREKLKNRL